MVPCLLPGGSSQNADDLLDFGVSRQGGGMGGVGEGEGGEVGNGEEEREWKGVRSRGEEEGQRGERAWGRGGAGGG